MEQSFHVIGRKPYSCTDVPSRIETNQLPVQPTSAHILGNSQQLAVSAGDHVQVPRICYKPCTFLLLLLSVIDRSQPSKQFRCDIYLRTIEIVGDHLQSEC